MKLAVAQLNPKIGSFHKTVEKAKEAVANARKQGATLVLFPELCTTGYPPRDLLDYPSFVDANLAALEQLATVADGITLVCGFVERNPGHTGRRLYNSAALLRNRKVEAVYRKTVLPNYDVFEEDRYFEAGQNEFLIFEQEGKCFAVSICEEIWNVPGFLDREYDRKPLEILKTRKVDALLNLSASPFHLGKPERRLELLKKIATTYSVQVFYASQVGANDELIFDGGSAVLSAKGEVVARAASFKEALLVTELGQAPDPKKIAAWPASKEEWHLRALEIGIHDYAYKVGASKLVLGLSGGIDSAVVAAVACEALGPENVLGVLLPSRFTANESLEDAMQLGKNLGMEVRTLSIEPVLTSYEKQWLETEGSPLTGVAHENLQPRIRMTWLMALANRENRLLLNTSNKSEVAMGYATLYGDSAGALAVLGDLVKNEVYALARYFNRDGELIPQNILDRAPSAELRPDQTDQQTLPPYDILDAQVRQVVESSRFAKDADRNQPEWKTFNRLFGAAEYKRRQLPPVLRVSPRAFGMGRRVPIAATPQEY